MIGSLILPISGLILLILLYIVYVINARQSGINNKIYKILMVSLLLGIISELLLIPTIYNHPESKLLIEVITRINSFITLTWIFNLCCYLLTIGKAYQMDNLVEHFKKNKYLKTTFIIYVIMLIVSCFLQFDDVKVSNGAYISGPALYFLYIAGAMTICLSIIVTIKKSVKPSNVKVLPLVIGTIFAGIGMVVQLLFPNILSITFTFTFEMYIMYFIFENPDLYLIKELEIAKKRADESNRIKTEFLSNMSHEIRTPMNAIIGFSEGILNESEFNEELARKDLTHIYSASNNLLEIINNILDISKIETGKEQLEMKEYSIGNVILELKSIIEARITNNKVKFITEIDENTPSKLIGDKTKVFQVLLNVLSNSVKYTEVGKITIKLDSEIKNDIVNLHIKISDTGFGIKKEDFDKLFEKFSRLEIATQKEIEGTGLGLVITKRLVTLMGGTIRFESEYGAGTIFYIDLPQKIANISPIGNIFFESLIEKKLDYLDCSSFKALIVDDNKLNLKVAEKILSNYKFNITCLDNGQECIDNIKEGNEYDIIFLDHMMPKMDGIQVMHILHKLDGYNIPPIIAFTANAITGMKEMYLEEGFNDYLSKPLNTNELDIVIKKYFREKVLENNKSLSNYDESNSQNITLKNEEQNNKENFLKEKDINVNKALLYVGDLSTFNEILKDFYDGLNNQFEEIEEAYNKEDYAKYTTLVHALKSNCKSLGITKLAELAYEHEQKGKANDISYIRENFENLKKEKERINEVLNEYYTKNI